MLLQLHSKKRRSASIISFSSAVVLCSDRQVLVANKTGIFSPQFVQDTNLNARPGFGRVFRQQAWDSWKGLNYKFLGFGKINSIAIYRYPKQTALRKANMVKCPTFAPRNKKTWPQSHVFYSRVRPDVVELVDTSDLGSDAARCGGSSPSIRTLQISDRRTGS